LWNKKAAGENQFALFFYYHGKTFGATEVLVENSFFAVCTIFRANHAQK